jgi:hypothetical protein
MFKICLLFSSLFLLHMSPIVSPECYVLCKTQHSPKILLVLCVAGFHFSLQAFSTCPFSVYLDIISARSCLTAFSISRFYILIFLFLFIFFLLPRTLNAALTVHIFPFQFINLYLFMSQLRILKILCAMDFLH